MNVSKKMSWIVILSSLVVLLPALSAFYLTAKKELLEKELAQHQKFIQMVADDFASDLDVLTKNLEKLDLLINRQLRDTNHEDIKRFEQRMARSADGAWRNRIEDYDGSTQAGLFLPPDYQIEEDTKRFYGRMFRVFETFGVAVNNSQAFENLWFLDHQRSELIYDLAYPDFVYRMTPDTDYTSTDWMTLASPERNPQRETKWTPPLFDEVPGTWIVSAVHPLDIGGEWVGVLGQDVHLKMLFRLISSDNDTFEGEQHILRDSEGDFILAGPWQKQLESETVPFTIDKDESGLLKLLSEPVTSSATLMGEVNIQGKSYQAIGIKLQPMQWDYLHLIPMDGILKPLVESLTFVVLFLVMIVVAVSILINVAVRRIISRPVERLVERTRLFSIGLKPEPISSWGSNELTELAQAIDVMNEDLDRETNRLAYMATHDELTGLPNRSLLDDRLEQIITYSRRNKTKAAVLFLDLDQFKTINDSLGHSIGDKLLQKVAERIAFQLREEDTVARFGGDEFVVLLSDFQHIRDVSNVAEKILFVIKQPYIIDGYDLSVTSSIGISICPDDSDDPETLIQNADTAMYLSKNMGRNAFQFYTRKIHDTVVRKLQLEDALRKAIEEQQFILYYQPKVNLTTKKIYGMEALIRWQHPDLGIVSPIEFIPLAEESGLIIEIGEWVIEEALRQMKAWTALFPWLSNMAINLSARQLQQVNFVSDIEKMLQQSGIDSSKIDFEITESMIMNDVKAAISVLCGIRQLGVSVSIDDFGTGYSSLSYLKHLPADSLKIDRTFIRDIVNDCDDQAITKSIIALADNLNLRVIAEGIEEPEQDALLTSLGCEYAQGYYYSRPVPAAEMQQLLLRQQNSANDI